MAVSQDLQDGFVQEFRSTVRDLTSRQVRYSYRQMAGRTALTTIAALVGAVVFVVGYGALDLAPSILLTFLVVIGRMSGPAAQIQQGFQNLALGLPAYESIAELMSDLRRDAQPRMPDVRHQLSGPIVFEAVSFQHPQADGVLSHGVADIDLVIQPGSVLGIAGTSGAGKTTLVDLLVGLLRPQSGRILVGDVALDERTLPDWRSALSYVSQDPFLFHDTVRRNLAWARPDATEHDMWDALARAGADQIVRGMEGALDAVVGERGTLVSGGERQRIALARALLRKPKLLVLDEATNAIDIESERVLLEQLLAMRPRPTIVIIAHRAETLALCERVVRMKAGQLHAEACSDASDPALLR
jgi:ABC-type multidrug transport system fused ATPase/permease subunit